MYSTRPQRKTLTKLCPYCGKTRTYTYRDGYDEVDYCTGRSRYIPSSTVDEGCDCMLGKLSHTAKKIQLKKQCANCVCGIITEVAPMSRNGTTFRYCLE